MSFFRVTTILDVSLCWDAEHADYKIHYVKIQHNYARIYITRWLLSMYIHENKVYRWLIVVFYGCGIDWTVIPISHTAVHQYIFPLFIYVSMLLQYICRCRDDSVLVMHPDRWCKTTYFIFVFTVCYKIKFRIRNNIFTFYS